MIVYNSVERPLNRDWKDRRELLTWPNSSIFEGSDGLVYLTAIGANSVTLLQVRNDGLNIQHENGLPRHFRLLSDATLTIDNNRNLEKKHEQFKN